MEKQIPIYFDNVIIASPMEKISETNPNLGRAKVGVFTKYGNRNGSYITDAVAEQLINSATSGMVPVVGFFDPETKTWASHTGPTLANAYGYVEKFDGWQPLQDTDGITRDYAVFSVVLFTEYFEQANLIVGQNQSMELDIRSIDGDWADIEGIEYFVYTTARIQGLCVIGSHEPCFSVSSFFSKNDSQYEDQYNKFSAMLSELKAIVEKENNDGGKEPMEENQVVDEFAQEPEVSEPEVIEPTIETPEESEPVNTEFEALQAQFNQLQADYEAAQARITELETFQADVNSQIETLRTQNEELQATVHSYEQQAAAAEAVKKNELVDKYEKILNAPEEIDNIRGKINDFSYDELESKLAVLFAHKQFAGGEINKVPLPEVQESEFSLLMKKYRK